MLPWPYSISGIGVSLWSEQALTGKAKAKNKMGVSIQGVSEAMNVHQEREGVRTGQKAEIWKVAFFLVLKRQMNQ